MDNQPSKLPQIELEQSNQLKEIENLFDVCPASEYIDSLGDVMRVYYNQPDLIPGSTKNGNTFYRLMKLIVFLSKVSESHSAIELIYNVISQREVNNGN